MKHCDFALRRRYEVAASHVEQGIRDGLTRYPGQFPANLSTNASDYCVSGFNMELEATPGAGAGLRLGNITIDGITNE